MNYLADNAMFYIQYNVSMFQKKFFKESDIIAYMGQIDDRSIEWWKKQIEVNGSTANERKIKSIVILLSTNGGSANAVEKMVEITRSFYEEVHFVILDQAMSAGTIWAMSGNKIYMHYASSLGPIDPQVPDPSGRYIPALGYLDKINEIIEKSRNNSVTQAELMMLQSNSLGVIRTFEQARDLSVELLKSWLVEYKFKDWKNHSSTGNPVSTQEKEKRAEEIAGMLSDNKVWHSHGRFIGIRTLQDEVKLKIDDFSDNKEMCDRCDLIAGSMREFMSMFSQPILIIKGDLE